MPDSDTINLANISVVLVGTRYPENIGAAARAMRNMGIKKLILVDPQNPDPARIGKMATHAALVRASQAQGAGSITAQGKETRRAATRPRGLETAKHDRALKGPFTGLKSFTALPVRGRVHRGGAGRARARAFGAWIARPSPCRVRRSSRRDGRRGRPRRASSRRAREHST